MSRQTFWNHALTLATCLLGIAGMGMVFQGAMHADGYAMSRGIPLLLIGLWWAGRELARSIAASNGRSRAQVGRTLSLPLPLHNRGELSEQESAVPTRTALLE